MLLAWVGGIRPVAVVAPALQLRYVVIITRHGVRSPTWSRERLNEYSAEPWPEWGVPPGYLTLHGRLLMKLMGTYYREWLVSEHLLSQNGCGDTDKIYIRADIDQRTLETGRALAESLLPGCAVAVHSAPEGSRDPLFSPSVTDTAGPDWEAAAQAVRERMGNDSNRFLAPHRAAFDALEGILAGVGTPARLLQAPAEITISVTPGGVQVDESLGLASTLSENLELEYAEGMQGQDLGWGRLDRATLLRILDLHTLYADLTRRTPYLARVRGSNFLDHVRRSMEQMATMRPVPGALGPPGATVLILVGHDTNLSNLSGMLGFRWELWGYPPDDTPPGGALMFSLWQSAGRGEYFVRTQYLAPTLEQMRNATPLSLSAPPASEEISVAGCQSAQEGLGCSWSAFAKSLQQAINLRYVVN
jgi:4-phytase/acid phosphatase